MYLEKTGNVRKSVKVVRPLAVEKELKQYSPAHQNRAILG
jgi:hypothetical protein